MNRIFIVATIALLAFSGILTAGGSVPAVATSFSGSGNVYSITATASGDEGISEMLIFMAKGAKPNRGDYTVAKACHSTGSCTYSGGNSNGAYSFYAQATDASFWKNKALSPKLTFYLPLETSTLQSSSANPASSGGQSGGAAGGSYYTAAKFSGTCAGQPATLQISYLASYRFTAQADLVYLGDNGTATIFSKNMTEPSEIQFVPEKAGLYEARVSAYGSQATTDFAIPGCGKGEPRADAGAPANLAPAQESVLSKSVDYGNGFAKEFKVYKITSGATASYSTEITLSYTNSGNGTIGNMTISDSVPRAVLANTGKMVFQNSPASLESSPEPHFTWNVRNLASGGRLVYVYRIERPLTEQMIAAFASPRLLSQGDVAKDAAGAAGTASDSGSSDLLAANIGVAGFSMPLSMLAASALGIVLLGLIMLFVFGRKKEE